MRIFDKGMFHSRPYRAHHNVFQQVGFAAMLRSFPLYTCVNSPIIDVPVMHNQFASLRLCLLPTFKPFVHPRSGGFAANVDRGDHLLPFGREGKAGEFEERAVFRIWHSIHLEACVGALHLLQVQPRELPLLRFGQY